MKDLYLLIRQISCTNEAFIKTNHCLVSELDDVHGKFTSCL